MSPSSMMMGFTDNKPIVNSKENFSNMVLDMGVQIQKQEPSNMNINMDMSYNDSSSK
jgi:hypothetical protein